MKKNALFALIAVAIALAVLEGASRFAAPWIAESLRTPNHYFTPCPDDDRMLCTDPAFISSGASRGNGMTPQRFARTEAADAFRAFLVGGSFLAGFAGPPLAAVLEGERTPAGNAVEVVNAAGNAYGSTRVLDVTREVTGYDADLIVLATGNNEFVGELPGPPRGVLGFLRRHSRLVGLVRLAALHARATGEEQEMMLFSPEGEFVVGRLVAEVPTESTPEQRAVAADRFRQNVDAIAETCAATGRRMLVIVLPINERFPPYLAIPGIPGGAPDDSPVVDLQRRRYAAYLALQRGDGAEALAAFRESYGNNPDPAVRLYLEAVKLETEGEIDRARDAYYRSIEQNSHRVRSDREFNRIVRGAAERHGFPVVDLDLAFRMQAAEDGRAFDDYLFRDPCHPNAFGIEVVLREVVGRLEAEGLVAYSPSGGD